MSQALTLARPYARAAFALARDGSALAGWSDALGFAARVAADPQVASLLGNPRADDADAVTLLSPPDGATARRSRASSRCWPTTAAWRCCRKSPACSRSCAPKPSAWSRRRVTSATALPAAELDTIKAALRKRFGREVEVETAVDESADRRRGDRCRRRRHRRLAARQARPPAGRTAPTDREPAFIC